MLAKLRKTFKRSGKVEAQVVKTTLEGHQNNIFSLAAMLDGSLVSGSCDFTARIWSKNGSCLRVLHHNEFVYALVILPDGGLLSGCGDGTISFWAKHGNKHERTIKAVSNDRVRSLAVWPDGSFASGSYKKIKLWSKDGECLQTLDGHEHNVSALVVLRDGRLVSGSQDKTIKIWSREGECLQTLKGHTEEVLALAVWPDGNFASGSRDGTIKLWSNEGACERTLQAQAIVSSLAILHDGRLASGCGNIKLWSRNGEYLQILEEKADVLVVMSDGRLATADEKIIKILENELVPRPISALEIVSPPVKAGTMKPDDDDVQQLEENTKADTPAGMKVSTVSVSHPEQKDVAVPMPEPVINLRSEYEGLKHVRDIEQKKDEMGITPFLKSLQQQITKQGEEIRELHEVLAQKEREFQEIRERLVRAERLLFPQTASGSTFGSSTLFQSPPASASLVAREQPLAGAIVLTADQMATSTSKSQERVDPVENAHETRTAFS